ncbi:cytochrome P450 [Amycolatopsis sp. CA-230715]|uniref:cytochrome P450 n=1 Tax=Amycolatopsis sp. CA-230715 TaxID=2745196 RepID=UPI001C01745D|nr:cytochrome P450 [Amycolatopsis sp. CA-230715]QWF85124.1 Epi-isozizaene 5-monooxygenase/(E)-beta-farnesene synthase [Amycolatopsis sp. CA-230715]
MTDAPGPEGGHLMGALSSFKSNSLGLITDLRQRYGGIVRVKLGPYLVHQLTDPDAIKHVLQDNPDNYRRGRFYQGFSLFMGRGMLTTDGAEWKKRKQLSQPFFQRARVEQAAPIITGCVEDLAERWSAADGEVVDVVDDLMWLSMGVLSRTLFGVDLRERAEELTPAVRFSLKAMIITGKVEQMLPRWIPTRYQRTLKRHQAVLNAAMDHVVAQHRAGHGDPDSLVTALLTATEPDTGEPWDARAIRAELKTHFMAGHETTGCGLAWTLHAIAADPAVRDKLVSELDSVLGGDTPTVDHLPRLPYLRQLVEESLRLHPPIWAFPRGAVADDEIGGYHIPAGSSLLIPPYGAHRDPGTWDSPEEFRPERFCPAHPKPARYSYLPFGGGARRCIGHHLATLEIQLTIAMLTQRFRFTIPPGQDIHPAGLVSLRPAGGLPLRIEKA